MNEVFFYNPNKSTIFLTVKVGTALGAFKKIHRAMIEISLSYIEMEENLKKMKLFLK